MKKDYQEAEFELIRVIRKDIICSSDPAETDPIEDTDLDPVDLDD